MGKGKGAHLKAGGDTKVLSLKDGKTFWLWLGLWLVCALPTAAQYTAVKTNMALTNALPPFELNSVWSLANSNNEYLDEAGDTYSDAYANFEYQNYNEYTSYVTNKEGNGETQTIKNNGKLGYSKENYPAFYAAINYASSNAAYTPPNGSSGWFLPSVGQWWDIAVSLGGMVLCI